MYYFMVVYEKWVEENEGFMNINSNEKKKNNKNFSPVTRKKCGLILKI